ncbi:MAG: ABC transporter permease, partial [Pseudomonadota bacterium]
MAVLTPVERTDVTFYAPISAAFGALAGLFVGTAQGSGILGLLIGAVAVAAMAFVGPNLNNERLARWGILAIVAIIGFFFAGIAGLIVGVALGWFFGWFIFWLYESRYRQYLAPYLTPGQVLWHYTFRVICGAIFVFLITPIIVVMPLSFNAQDFFTFT